MKKKLEDKTTIQREVKTPSKNKIDWSHQQKPKSDEIISNSPQDKKDPKRIK